MRIVIPLVAVLLLSLAGLVSAAPEVLSLEWWTVDAGGGISQGGDYLLNGVAGQPEAGPRMSGGDFILTGGFLGGTASLTTADGAIYLPMVVR